MNNIEEFEIELTMLIQDNRLDLPPSEVADLLVKHAVGIYVSCSPSAAVAMQRMLKSLQDGLKELE